MLLPERKNFLGDLLNRFNQRRIKIGNKINEWIALVPFFPLMGTTFASLLLKLSLELTPLTIFLCTLWILIVGSVFIKTQKIWNEPTTRFIEKYGIYPLLVLSFCFALVLEVSLAPAHGQFMNNAQDWMNRNLNSQNDAQIKTAIDLIFNVLRGIFIVYIASEVIKIINSRDENDDWKQMAKKPLIVLMAVVVGDTLIGIIIGPQ